MRQIFDLPPDCIPPLPEELQRILELDLTQSPERIIEDLLQKILDDYIRRHGLPPLSALDLRILTNCILNPGNLACLAGFPPEYLDLIKILQGLMESARKIFPWRFSRPSPMPG